MRGACMSFDSPTPDAVARNLLLPAAELGLFYRPIHLLIGKLPWSDCLSPYTRDLTITLDEFVDFAPSQGLPIPAKPAETHAQENWYYEIAQIFTSQAPKRLSEKLHVEKSLGIHRLASPEHQSVWIDSGRIDWQATDCRLCDLGTKLTNPHPVWFILNPETFAEPETLLTHIVHTLERSLSSLTLCGTISQAVGQALQSQASQTLFYWEKQSPHDATNYEKAAKTLARTILGENSPQMGSADGLNKSGPVFRIKA